MTKNDEVAAAEAPVADAAPAASPAASHAEEEEELDIDIDGGYLQKKGSNPINPWNKRYFAFGTEPVSLNNLQTVHKRNERRVKATPKAAAAPAAATPAATEIAAAPTSEIAAGKVPDKETPAPAAAAAPAAEPAKSVQEIYEEANRDLLVNVAQANSSGTGLLYYHKSDDELHRQNVLGIINLRDVNSVEHVEKSTKNRSFKVSTKNRDYHFSAESPQKAKGWVKAIKEKSDEAKAAPDPYSNAAFQDVYKKLVAREAFDHAKNAANIISDNEINSDGEPDDIEVENGTPIIKKRKSFFGFSAVATSHEKKKADGITTEVSTEQKKDLTHVQEGDVDALKTHESENAVSHTTDAVTPPAAPESPKAKSGGFKLFGKKPAKEEPAPPPAPAPHPLTVDEAKTQALKAVDDAVAASKAKEAEAKKDTPPAPPAPEKKPSFFAGLFGKKPAPAPAPPPVANEETVVVSSEKTLSDVVTAEGEVTSQSSGGFFSRVTKGKDKNEVEVKSGEVSSEDVITAENVTHEQHIEGTDANIAISDGEQRVDLSTTDETLSTEDKIDRKPSLLKRLSGVVRATLAATEEVKVEETVSEETISEESVIAEETTTTMETEVAVEETKVAATVEVTA
ncbi:hypothetical protein BGZ47_008118 [Haplosporangium gracile]|nr:hypothetical protein BGZ47_008118 [Haplosporangium gracile]